MDEKEMMKHAEKICDILQDRLALKPITYGEPLKGAIHFVKVEQYCKENNLYVWLDIEDIVNEEIWLEIMDAATEEEE